MERLVNSLLGPLVLTTNLVFLFRREIVLDVECFADFFGGFPFDHVRDCFASDIKQGFNVKIVGSL